MTVFLLSSCSGQPLEVISRLGYETKSGFHQPIRLMLVGGSQDESHSDVATGRSALSRCSLTLGPLPLFVLSNLTPAMLGPKPPHPRNQKRVSRVVRLSPAACLLFH